ncbi:WAS/WASL-interacting protein family member 3-like isoform X1 [Aquila chrysaetos chrysaetos]|uniref:WAS/WASL-interacting protein family member 3-like isoform X1 n=1 Tax=Aquila chrysaetos chrysaetos TaxID=223781 RepID=UPI001176A6AB|nr:WAS/WASL-interacting protein family member 3-like isoform X1 [Aquila chrysaetos chrysaetos]
MGEEKTQEEAERKKPPGWVTICTPPPPFLNKNPKKTKKKKKKPNSRGNQRCSDRKLQPSCRGCGGEQPGGPRRGTPLSRPGHPGSPPPRTPALPAPLPPPPPPPPPPRPPLPRFLLLPSCPGAVAAAPASPPFPGSSCLPPAREAKPKKKKKKKNQKKTSGENTRHLSHPSNPGAAATAECARRRRTAPAEGSAAGRYLPAPGAAGRQRNKITRWNLPTVLLWRRIFLLRSMSHCASTVSGTTTSLAITSTVQTHFKGTRTRCRGLSCPPRVNAKVSLPAGGSHLDGENSGQGSVLLSTSRVAAGGPQVPSACYWLLS